MATGSTRLRGLETAWLHAGQDQRSILLFLHGFPDSAATWEKQIEHFKSQYHVVAPFTRGAGPSQKATDLARYGSDSICLDNLQILEQIDPEGQLPVIVVGHDLGAVHAWNLAPLLAPRLHALILINGLSLQAMMGRLRSLHQHRRSWYIYAMQFPILPETLARHFPEPLLDLAHRLGRLPEANRPSFGEVKDCLEHPLNQYRAFVRDIPKFRRRQLPRLSCPLLVLWGKEDPFLITPALSEWEQLACDVTSRVLPAGHWVHRERPAEVNRLIEKFLIEKVWTKARAA